MNTTLASTTGLVNEAQIKDMPLNGRSFDQLLTLTPGTVNYSSNVNLQGNFFSVVGRRPEENKYTISGIEYLGANSAGQPSGPYGASGQLLGLSGFVVPAPWREILRRLAFGPRSVDFCYAHTFCDADKLENLDLNPR